MSRQPGVGDARRETKRKRLAFYLPLFKGELREFALTSLRLLKATAEWLVKALRLSCIKAKRSCIGRPTRLAAYQAASDTVARAIGATARARSARYDKHKPAAGRRSYAMVAVVMRRAAQLRLDPNQE